MTLGEHITEVLLDDATLTGIVGERIFRIKGPQGVQAPCVMFTIRLQEKLYDMNHRVHAAIHKVQFNCFGDDAGVSEKIAARIEEILEPYTGTREGVEITNLWISEDDDDDFSDDVEMFRHIVTAVVTHRKTT